MGDHTTPALLVAATLTSFIAFTWLALAMDVHWHQVHGRGHPGATPRRALRLLGASGIAVSLLLCLAADHPTIAVLVWVMLLPLTAGAVAMTLSWRPGLLRPLWPVAMRL